MSMMLLHASPHRHGQNGSISSHVGIPIHVSVDFEIHDQDHPIGYDVEIQCWSNINDNTWKEYPLKLRDPLCGSRSQYQRPPPHPEVRNIRTERGRWWTISAAGTILPKTEGSYQCTFRGRYKAKFTDDWSQWYWIGERDHFGYDRNGYITIFPKSALHRLPTGERYLSKLSDICYQCLSRNGEISYDAIPSYLLRKLRRLNDDRWFRCIACCRSYGHADAMCGA